MSSQKQMEALLGSIREVISGAQDVLFAYLYGSRVQDPGLPGSDIDLGVYLKPSGIELYVRRDKELTALLVSHLHTDQVDLRIMNVAPLPLQYRILKEGALIFSRDELQRSEFETQVMTRFFDLKPYLDEYREMLVLRIRGAS